MEKRNAKPNPIENLFTGIGNTSAQFLSDNREDVTGLEMGERGPVSEKDIDSMILKGIAPDLPEYDSLNREQRRRADKILRQYKKQMGLG